MSPKVLELYKQFFKGHERSVKAKKNILASFGFKILSILTNLVLVPVTIQYVNTSQYGIWIILSSVINWMNLFDVGLGNGLRNKISQTSALGQYKRSRVYISSTYAIMVIIAFCIFLIIVIANSFIDWYKVLNVSKDSIKNLDQLILLLVAFFCFQFVFQIINVVLTAVHKTSVVSFISGISQIATLITVFIFISYTKGSLIYLIVAFSGIPLVIQAIATVRFFSQKFKYLSPSIRLINLKRGKSLLNLGGYFFLIQIGSLILFETDNIVIAQLFGIKEVTNFNIAYKLFSILVNIFTIIITPFWSAFTDAYMLKDITWINNIFRKLYIYWIVTVIISVCLLIISPYLYKFWLKDISLNIPSVLSISMVFYVAGFCWLLIHCYLLNGIGKIKLQFILYIISTIINIPIAIYLGKKFGVAGVTLSNVLVFCYMGVFLFIQCRKILNNSATGIWNQ